MTRLASRQPVTLIGGAPVPRADLDAALALAPVLAAADGGADAALANGLVPQAVWGDFDIASPNRTAPISKNACRASTRRWFWPSAFAARARTISSRR
jgi:thiamine pyrophosphokinase